MKYFYLLLILIGFNLNAQTSLSVYNYLTKGYALDLETGRDLKKGYFIERIDGASSNIMYKGKKYREPFIYRH